MDSGYFLVTFGSPKQIVRDESHARSPCHVAGLGASRVPEKWRKDFDIDRLLRVLIFCMEVSAVETSPLSGNCENNNSVENKRQMLIKDDQSIPISI